MTTAEEMIERAARAIEPEAFQEDDRKRHMFCSPSSVEWVQNNARQKARAACAVAVEMCAEMITPPDTEGGEYFDGLRGQAARFKALATAIKGE